MKRIYLFFALLLFAVSNAQQSSKIINTQATPDTTPPTNMAWVDNANNNNWHVATLATLFAVTEANTAFNTRFNAKSTDNLSEGSTNKYFSNLLARAAFSNGTGLDYSAGVFALNSATQLSLGKADTALQPSSSLDPANIAQTSTYRFATDAEKANWNAKQNALVAGTDYLQPNGNGSALTGLTKTQVGLSNVDNTPDTSKPISTAQAAVNLTKQDNITLTTTGTGVATLFGATLNIPTPATPSFNNTPSRTIVTTAAAANGFQISTTRNTIINYSATIVSTATIAGSATGYIVLEICPTNSSIAGDWIEIGRIPNGQAVSLAITLQSVSTGGGQVGGVLPAGYYARLRSVNTAGTPVYTYNSGQEVQL